jgi:hypothetical protein
MRARVIEISDQQIYLEVDKQLRFRSEYKVGARDRSISRDDSVDFVIECSSGHPRVVIESVVDTNARRFSK